MTDKLKPCPFCGMGEMDPEENIPNLVDGMNSLGNFIFVTCLNCNASGPVVAYEVRDNVVTSWPDAVKEWNRNTLQELEEMRVALRAKPRNPDAPPGYLPLDDLQNLRRLYFEKLEGAFEAGQWSQEKGRGGGSFQAGRWQAWFAAIDALETLILIHVDR